LTLAALRARADTPIVECASRSPITRRTNAGTTRAVAADYLDKEYTRANAVHDARGSQTRLARRSAASSLFDPLIDNSTMSPCR
jgi:hypothetical protein